MLKSVLSHRCQSLGLLTLLGTGLSVGCRQPQVLWPLPPLSLQSSMDIVNANVAKIGGTLRAVGPVDGHFTTDEGRKRRFHVDGTLFFLAPHHLRFDLKALGDRQFLFGSNATQYWVYTKQDGEYFCGDQGTPESAGQDIPIRPDQLMDALGLLPMGKTSGDGRETIPVQRVVDEYQQVLFLERNEQGEVSLQKEYWLDRYEPRLVRKVVFRNGDGVVEMISNLTDYAAISKSGPLLPSRIEAEWPTRGAVLRFRVRRWKQFDQVGPNSVQFATPPECP